MNDYAARGFSSEVALRDAVLQAQHIFDDATHSYRWAYVDNDEVVVLLTRGNQHIVEDIWRIPLQGDFAWNNDALTLAEALSVEQRAFGSLKVSLGLGHTDLPLLRTHVRDACTQENRVPLSSDSASDAAVPVGLFGANRCLTNFAGRIEDIMPTSKALGKPQELLSAVATEASFNFAKQKAEFQETQTHLWFWDDGSTQPTDCNTAPSSWPSPAIRRCNGYVASDAGTVMSMPARTYYKSKEVPTYLPPTEVAGLGAGISPCDLLDCLAPMIDALYREFGPKETVLERVDVPHRMPLLRLGWQAATGQPHVDAAAGIGSVGALYGLDGVGYEGMASKDALASMLEDNWAVYPSQADMDAEVKATFSLTDDGNAFVALRYDSVQDSP